MKDTLFFNAVFNYKSETGPSKYVWGVKDFDLSIPIKRQVFTYLDNDVCERSKAEDAFNFNLTAFNQIVDKK